MQVQCVEKFYCNCYILYNGSKWHTCQLLYIILVPLWSRSNHPYMVVGLGPGIIYIFQGPHLLDETTIVDSNLEQLTDGSVQLRFLTKQQRS